MRALKLLVSLALVFCSTAAWPQSQPEIVSDERLRLRVSKQAPDDIPICAVAADDPVISEELQVTRS